MNYHISVISLALLLLLLGACGSSPSEDTPVPSTGTEAPTVAAEESVIPTAPATPTSQPASTGVTPTSEPVEETEAAADATPAADTVSTPTPNPTPIPSPTPVPTEVSPVAPEEGRDLALDFLRSSYRVKLPENESFGAIEELEDLAAGLATVATYRSGPWLVAVSEAESDGGASRTVVVANEKTGARWWGQVDENGLVVTTLVAGFRTPPSRRVRGWVGKVVTLPPGSPYDDYFVNERRGSSGINASDEDVLSILESLEDYPGLVKIYGEVVYGVDDYNGRQILVRRIEPMDGPFPQPEAVEASSEALAEAAAGSPEVQAVEAAGSPTPTPFFGPSGALTGPLPGSILLDRIRVSGQAESVFENNVIVRIETEDGEILGEGFATLDASEIGGPGKFVIELDFKNPESVEDGRIALYAEDPRDGSLLLLAWANIRLSGLSGDKSGAIAEPEEGQVINRSVYANGTATGLDDGTVLVRVEDRTGSVWGWARTKTDADGNWELKMRFKNPPSARPGRIAVYEEGPDGTLTLLASRDLRIIE